MLTLPAGMDEKILLAQQTIYNNAEPELRIRAYQTVAPPLTESLYGVWLAAACSDDGEIIYASGYPPVSGIWVSEDSGSNWENRNELIPALNLACTADGYTVIAADHTPYVHISRDGGRTWDSLVMPHKCQVVACSADGTRIIAGGRDTPDTPTNHLYVSPDSGETWTERDAPGTGYFYHGPFDVACSSDGIIIFASYNDGYTYTSDDFGETWTKRESPGNAFYSVACSDDGTLAIASAPLGHIYTSDDFGASWTERKPAGDVIKYWMAVACSADGGVLLANYTDQTDGGHIYRSPDGGVTWYEIPVYRKHARSSTTTFCTALACTADGSRMVAGELTGYLWLGLIPYESGVTHYSSYWIQQGSGALGTDKNWTAITSWGPSKIWICNDVGQIYFYNGTSWTLQHDLGAVNGWTLECIQAFGEKNVWACGHRPNGPYGEHVILHYTVAGWQVSLADEGPPLTWMGGGSPSDIWVVGHWGLRYRWNGTAWSTDQAPDTELYAEYEMVRFVCVGSSHIWGVGHGGRVFLFDGADWNNDDTYFVNSNIDLENVTASSRWRVIVSGNRNGDEPVILYNNRYGEIFWLEKTDIAGLVASPMRGIWSWRNGQAFIAASGDKVLDTSNPANPLDVQFVEGTDPAIEQFMRFPGNNVWAVGHSTGGSGVWKMANADQTHTDISKYLQEGTLQLDYATPVATLQMTLENPNGILMAEDGYSLVGLGAYFEIAFRIGSTAWTELGRYYVDRATCNALDGTVKIDARNTAGKYIMDLPVPIDELYHEPPYSPATWVENILALNGVADYEVYADAGTGVGFVIPRQTLSLDAIKQILSARPWWRIVEDFAGKIIIGPPEGSEGGAVFGDNFPPVGTYEFVRGTDLFSREVIHDDREVYSQVCVVIEDTVITGEDVAVGNGETLIFQLEHRPVVEGSETIYLDGQPLVRHVDYEIDYTDGKIDLTTAPDLEILHNRVEVAKWTIAHETLAGQGCPRRVFLRASNDNYVAENVQLCEAVFPAFTGEMPVGGPLEVTSNQGLYRYYSIDITEAYGGLPPSVTHLKLMDANGAELVPTMTSPVLPEPMLAEASSEVTPAWKAFDGDDDTAWCAGAGVWWLKVDFGTGGIGEEGAKLTADYTAATAVYRGVPLSTGYIIPENKTLFIPVPAGTGTGDAAPIAEMVADQIGSAGKQENYVGPIRPQLFPGDQASIDTGGVVGSIMTVKHYFGREGFLTEFTVDSGGRLGSPTLKDLLDRTVEKLKVDKATRKYYTGG